MSVPLDLIIQGLGDANATKYFTAAGIVMLLYDHLLTILDEYQYVWKAPGCFTKYAFLLNRYLVPCILIAITHEMCGFGGISYTDRGCQQFLTTTSFLSIISIATANILVLLRVLLLWKGNKAVRWCLYGTYALSICVTFSMMLLAVIQVAPSIRWSPIVNMCIVTKKAPSIVALWGTPMFFELIVISSVVYHAIASPRSAEVPLTQALRKDGLVFFLTVMTLKFFNMIVAIVSRPGLVQFAVFFIWSSVTTVLNRSLLRLRKAETEEHRNPMPTRGRNRASSPPSIPTQLELMTIPEGDTTHRELMKSRRNLHAMSSRWY